MNMRELNTNTRSVTVTLSYDELRCINNAMYEVSRFDDIEKDDNFDAVYAGIIELTALLKHGKIPEFELELMYRLLCKNEDKEGVDDKNAKNT